MVVDGESLNLWSGKKLGRNLSFDRTESPQERLTEKQFNLTKGTRINPRSVRGLVEPSCFKPQCIRIGGGVGTLIHDERQWNKHKTNTD